MAFNVAKIASARASLTISLTKSLRVAGPLVQHTRFERLRERTLSLLEVLINIDFLITFTLKYTNIINVTHFQAIIAPSLRNSDVTTLTLKSDVSGAVC